MTAKVAVRKIARGGCGEFLRVPVYGEKLKKMRDVFATIQAFPVI